MKLGVDKNPQKYVFCKSNVQVLNFSRSLIIDLSENNLCRSRSLHRNT